MAATLTPDGELTYFSFPIEKSEETPDGDLIVYGKATDGTVDSDLQIIDQDWSAKAIQDWLATGGNVRVQHQARRDPAGRGLEVQCTPDGHYVKSLVVEPVAKELVRKGVLTCYSVGVTMPDIVPDPTGKAMNGIIRGRSDGLTKISEISLVDRGANFNSKFQLVKAAGDGGPEFIGKMFVDANAIGEIVKANGESLAGGRVTPADLAKMLTGHDGVAKRKMDPDVGGGVDRDKIPAADFAGRDRSFPIVTPGDVSDAASSIGRAGDDNYSADQLKKNIIRIARRKGSSFVAELPEAWKKELGMSDSEKDVEVEVEKTEDAEDAVEKAGVPPQFVKDKDDGDDDDKADKAEKSDDSSDEDGDDKEPDDDEEDVKKSEAVADVEKVVSTDVVEKKDKVMCRECGANVHAEHNFCSECGGNLKTALPIVKNHDFTCLKCGNQLDKGEKFCPSCGKEHPGYLPEADSKVKTVGDNGSADKVIEVATTVHGSVVTEDDVAKAARKAAKKAAKRAEKKATPTDGVEEAADAESVPEHCEPDGPAIEALEHDAGLPTVPDSTVKAVSSSPMFVPGDFEASASMRLKSLGVPLDYGVLHDLTCPCFHPDDVAKSYPRFDLSSLDAAHWQQKAFDMAASAPLDQARKANELWQHVVTLKNTDPRYVTEIRSDLYKEFRDANPGPGSFPSPGAIHAGSFNRALVTAGHEASSPGHGGANTSPVSFGGINAGMYDRGYLTGGHAAESPSDQQGMMKPVSVPSTTGVPVRTYYTNAMRDNARQAMLAMHDHIAQTFPDLCPAFEGPSPYPAGALPGSRPVPAGVGGPTPHGAATKAEKKSKKVKHPIGIVEPTVVETPAAVKVADVTKAATLDMDVVQDLITKAVADANSARDAEVAGLRKELKKARKQLDVIAAQPDPVGPYRGVAFEQIQKPAAPEVLPASRVERTQEALFQALHYQWRNDPDPMQREVAWREINKMSGIGTNPTYK